MYLFLYFYVVHTVDLFYLISFTAFRGSKNKLQAICQDNKILLYYRLDIVILQKPLKEDNFIKSAILQPPMTT